MDKVKQNMYSLPNIYSKLFGFVDALLAKARPLRWLSYFKVDNWIGTLKLVKHLIFD